MAAAKAIRITSNLKKNVAMSVDLRPLKKSVLSLRQRVPVSVLSLDGTSTTLLASAKNSYIVDAKAIGIDSLTRTLARQGVTIPELYQQSCPPVLTSVVCRELKDRVGQLSFNGTSTRRPDVASDSIMAGVKEMATASTIGLRVRGPVSSSIWTETPAIYLKNWAIAMTIASAGTMTSKTRDVIDSIIRDARAMRITLIRLKNAQTNADLSLSLRLSSLSNISRASTVSNHTIPVPAFAMRFDGSMIRATVSVKSSYTAVAMAMKISLCLGANVKPSAGTRRTYANCKLLFEFGWRYQSVTPLPLPRSLLLFI